MGIPVLSGLGVFSVLSGGAVTERLRIVHCDNVTGVHGWLSPSLAQLLECFRLPSNEPLRRRTRALLVAIYGLPSPNVTVGPAAAASSLLLGWLCRHHLGLGPVLSFHSPPPGTYTLFRMGYNSSAFVHHTVPYAPLPWIL